MSLSLNGTDGVTFNDGSEQWAAASPIGPKNLIINGDMRIAQRGTSVTGITTAMDTILLIDGELLLALLELGHILKTPMFLQVKGFHK